MKTLKISVKVLLFVAALSLSANAQKPQAPKSPINKVDKRGKVYTSVQNQPSFPGGLSLFGKYLAKNIKYPEADKWNNVTGKVFVRFIIERDGSISNVTAIKGPSEAMKNEAVRVLKNSPKWNPGITDGRKVRVEYVVPVNFILGA